MQKTKIVFFGTHNFAAVILEGLLKNPDFSVDLVITQPDKPVGRRQELQKSPVKILAEKYNLKIDQPDNLKTYNLQPKTYNLSIVAQYGLLIPENIINAPKYGTINVHTSLLPKYRGASPIQCALMNGEDKTGITIMKMDKGLDTGPILLQKTLKIQLDDTYLTLDEKLAVMGSQALKEAIPDYIDGKITPKPQNHKKATECRQLSREDGKIDWGKTAPEIYNLYRGLTPWPGVWTVWPCSTSLRHGKNDKRIKLLKIQQSNKKLKPGLVKIEDNRLFIGCACPAKPKGRSGIEVLELQLEGKKPMNVKEFINGHKNINSEILK